MSTPFYCGIKKPPSGKRVGTFDECLRNNQIRRYGLIAVTPEQLEKLSKKPTPRVKKPKVEVTVKPKRVLKTTKAIVTIPETAKSRTLAVPQKLTKIKPVIRKRKPKLPKNIDEIVDNVVAELVSEPNFYKKVKQEMKTATSEIFPMTFYSFLTKSQQTQLASDLFNNDGEIFKVLYRVANVVKSKNKSITKNISDRALMNFDWMASMEKEW